MTPEQVRERIHKEYATALSKPARNIGVLTARRLFGGRGNHSEIHLSEVELAAVIATAVETYIQGLSS